jgi:RNA-directed DNA polymerase
VLKAVAAHEHRPALIHHDIKDFFPSVPTRRVVGSLINRGILPSLARLIAEVCTVDNQLPQGAPTSVSLGNLVLQQLDRRLTELCRREGLTYTRYIDDLAISGGAVRLRAFAPLIVRIIKGDGWIIGEEKGGFSGPDEYREYLGVSIGGFLDIGSRSALKHRLDVEALERGDIDLLTFEQRTGWARAVRASSFAIKRKADRQRRDSL